VEDPSILHRGHEAVISHTMRFLTTLSMEDGTLCIKVYQSVEESIGLEIPDADFYWMQVGFINEVFTLTPLENSDPIRASLA
jgi:hypothetical protein